MTDDQLLEWLWHVADGLPIWGWVALAGLGFLCGILAEMLPVPTETSSPAYRVAYRMLAVIPAWVKRLLDRKGSPLTRQKTVPEDGKQ